MFNSPIAAIIIEMNLSEELIWRGFQAETTVKDPAELDTRVVKKFYWGAEMFYALPRAALIRGPLGRD